MRKKGLLALSTGLLLSLPWLGLGGWWLLGAFVPLLMLGDQKPRRYGWWVILAFFVWIMLTTWWVGVSTWIATVAVPLVGLFFSATPFLLFHRFRFRVPAALDWSLFVTLWIAFEALYLYNEISFPWLTLGYGFAREPWLVQWYEWTGSLGGSLWVLVSNVLIYNTWKTWEKRRWIGVLPALLWIAVPTGASLIRYATYREQADPVRVAVIQPNIDPYNEKFSGLTSDEQRDKILSLVAQADPAAQLVVTPETAFDDMLWEESLASNRTVGEIRRSMARYPDGLMVAGATTFSRFEGPRHRWPSYVRPLGRGMAGGYAAYNTAMGIDTSASVQLYHKSKLVCGVETIPYPQVLGLLEYVSIDLGGFSGNYGSQPTRSLLVMPDGRQIGTAICYESVYGDYFADYIRQGASLMTIITNDGWWGDTPGYHQHLSFARLRAVETRRSIARSANTGISALINQRGDVTASLGWDREGIIEGTLNANSAETLYVRRGDYIARLSLYLLALCTLYLLNLRFRRRLPK